MRCRLLLQITGIALLTAAPCVCEGETGAWAVVRVSVRVEPAVSVRERVAPVLGAGTPWTDPPGWIALSEGFGEEPERDGLACGRADPGTPADFDILTNDSRLHYRTTLVRDITAGLERETLRVWVVLPAN
jgi:hypothetical protein